MAQGQPQLTEVQKKEVFRLFNIFRNWAGNLSAYSPDDLKTMLYLLIQEIVAQETLDLDDELERQRAAINEIRVKLGMPMMPDEEELDEEDEVEEGEEDEEDSDEGG